MDPRHAEWKAKQALKPKDERSQKPRELFEPPSLPIKTRSDIENALKDMYCFWQGTATSPDDLGDFTHLLLSFGMASNFLGYLPPPGLPEKSKGISLDDLPDAFPIYLEYMNKAYSLFQEVRDSGQPTENQISRMYRISWRTKVFAHTEIIRMRVLADQED